MSPHSKTLFACTEHVFGQHVASGVWGALYATWPIVPGVPGVAEEHEIDAYHAVAPIDTTAPEHDDFADEMDRLDRLAAGCWA